MAPTAGTRLRFKNARSKKPQQAKKVPSLKNRIRGLERFLSRGGLADAARRAKKAELQQLKDEFENKEHVAQEKKNAEKYKRPRFFERVKVMRKLRQAKNRLEQANDDSERAEHEKFKTYREEMMYIYYYPKTEPYISLFPSAPHSEENQKRQKELRAEAIARFEKEQPTEAFHQFCFNDGKSKDSNSVSEARPAVELLLKKPTKEMVKKQQKEKARSKRDKSAEKPKHTPALVDQDDDDEMPDAAKAESNKDEEEEEEQEEDDFFL
ncbi:hypothetical protein PF005_g13713 [Phytophthora fragariae]|uniref:rRNA-processing protein EFG1 n=1 Tax=Phytophthora fragariae TaxID=53985 RepID=A0A6A3XSF7_9STRA|nr:hypothetical protein PF003_g9520 [Phytophthora fragariae]KAE8934234.1 hypothetical protein PF009_g15781 [Phytophthora fragariae]KAE9000371.1 hypothetical protein PF011_g14208 [Phytophthora fragariae]KAE9072922.1 hypothetical protein PF010_g25287 [Phytophthora fragariae]KAE9103571.1 hypothetical protein PF007_g14362 [Phytophthora fragariae]